MNLRWTKAVRELGVHPQRTFLVVLALVLGLWGVGTLLVSESILTPDLASNFSRTVPSHVNFVSDDLGKLDLAEFRALPQVQAAELRDFSLQRIEVRPNVWLPLFLYGVDDLKAARVARIVPQTGASVPPAGSVLIERDGLHVSDIVTGSRPRVRVGGHIVTLPVSGIVFDAAQAPATQDAFIYAYADRPTFAALTGLPTSQRLIVRLNDVHSLEDVRRVAEVLTQRLAAQGIRLNSKEIPPFEQHPHQWQLRTLLFLVGAIGLLAFAMAAVLVSQLMRALLAGQVRQIGILKAVGASGGQVLQIYASMLLLMGAVAGAIGIPLAVLTGRAFSAFVAAKLNFDILTQAPPLYVFAVLVLASLFSPLLLSLPTLIRSTLLTAREALSDYGMADATPTALLPTSRLPVELKLALRNVLRDRRRLGVTVLSMALGVAIFDAGFNVRESLGRLLTGTRNEMRYDVQIALGKPTSRAQALRPFQDLPNIAQLETWSGGRGEVQSRISATSEGVGVVALPRETNLLKLNLVQGRWLRASEQVEVVLNQQAWLAYARPTLGSRFEIVIGSQPLKVVLVGVAQQFEKPKLYLDQGDYDARFNPERRVTTLLLRAEQSSLQKVLKLKRDIETAVARSDLDVLYVMSHAERMQIIYDHLNIILSTLLLLSFLVLVVSAIGNASAVGISILERTREFGILRAIGATPQTIARLLRAEGILVSLLGISFGLLLSYPISAHAAELFGHLMLGPGAQLAYAFSSVGFVITALTTFAFGFVASSLPAKSALRVPTHQALSYE